MIGKQQMRAEPAAVLAYLAAAAGVVTMAPDDFDDDTSSAWPALCDPAAGMSEDVAYVAVTTVLAPFVRRHPDAPAEALYRQARELHVHKGPPHGWQDLPAHVRFAFELFREVLVQSDGHVQRQADEAKAKAAAAAAAKKPRRPARAHESALEQIDSPLSRERAAPRAKPKSKTATAKKTK